MRMSGSIIVLPATTRGGLLFGLLTYHSSKAGSVGGRTSSLVTVSPACELCAEVGDGVMG